MLRITLEREQTYLFPQHSNSSNYELEVINQEHFAEIKFSSFIDKKVKRTKRASKKVMREQEPMLLFQ
jgi:hypothetical protein